MLSSMLRNLGAMISKMYFHQGTLQFSERDSHVQKQSDSVEIWNREKIKKREIAVIETKPRAKCLG